MVERRRTAAVPSMAEPADAQLTLGSVTKFNVHQAHFT
jgi:hypothetical protein